MPFNRCQLTNDENQKKKKKTNKTSAIDAWELLHPAVPIVCGYLITLTLVALFIAGHMDPGIIPRDPSNKLEGDPEEKKKLQKKKGKN
jgi:hypothetical protein